VIRVVVVDDQALIREGPRPGTTGGVRHALRPKPTDMNAYRTSAKLSQNSQCPRPLLAVLVTAAGVSASAARLGWAQRRNQYVKS
jgi:hypothetical protein